MKIKKPATSAKKVQAEATELKTYTADSVTVTVKRGGQYGSWGVSFSQTKSVADDADVETLMDEIEESLDAKCEAYLEKKGFTIDLSELEEAGGEEEEETEEEGGEEEGEEDAITEEDINEMSKADLVALIEEHGLDIDVKKVKKLADLRALVIEEMAGEEEEEEEEGEEEVGEEEIREMSREELIAYITENELDVKYKKIKKLDELRDAVVEAVSEEELTEELVREMTRDELLELIKNHDLDVNPKKLKKTPALMEAVIEELFGEDEGVDGEDADFEDGFDKD